MSTKDPNAKYKDAPHSRPFVDATLFDNKGVSHQEVLERYLDAIQAEYDLSVDEICSILGVSLHFVNMNVLPYIKRVILGPLGRGLLKIAAKEGYEDVGNLKNKRILVSRKDFWSYIVENTKIQIRFRSIPFERIYDFGILNDDYSNRLKRHLRLYVADAFGKAKPSTECVLSEFSAFSEHYLPISIINMKGDIQRVLWDRACYETGTNKAILFGHLVRFINESPFDVLDHQIGIPINENTRKSEQKLIHELKNEADQIINKWLFDHKKVYR